MSVTQLSHRPERGFSLIEVLVAMLVLAIGLLGLAALQTQGVRFNHDAYVRSNATALAYDIVDKMRINRANAASYTTANFPVRNAMPADGYSTEEPTPRQLVPSRTWLAGSTVSSLACPSAAPQSASRLRPTTVSMT